MNKKKILIVLKNIAIGIGIALFVLIILKEGHEIVVTSKNSVQKIGYENIGELATQAAYVKEVGKISAEREIIGLKVPFSESMSIYTYDFIIKAGFDFDNITWELIDNSESGLKNEIKVYLPAVRVLSNEIKFESFESLFESTSPYSRIKPTDINEALLQMKRNAEANAIENGLFDAARNNAETILKVFFTQAFDTDYYDINFY